MSAILEAQDVTKRFSGLTALEAVSFAVEQGEVFGIIGPNGAGKTTVFNCVTRIFPVTSGRFRFMGRDITDLRTHEIVRGGISRTFQITHLFTGMAVFENVLAGRHTRTQATRLGSILGLPKDKIANEQDSARVEELLEFVGLSDVGKQTAKNLSFGDQRRLAVAVALATEPKVLLLDEPAAGMNPEEKRRMAQLILEIRARGTTIVVIEHDMKVIMGICDQIAVLDFGRKIAEGSPKEIANNERVISAYLGTEANA
jgi:branched-chain amino acid transport system ATP-binding protein